MSSISNNQKQNLSEVIDNYTINAKELSKAFQGKIPETFLNSTIAKTFNSIKKRVKNTHEINDIIKVSEAVILYTRGEMIKEAARIYLSSLCCFKHENEEVTLTLYMPSLWIIGLIHKRILAKKRRKYNSLEEEIFNEFKRYDFPVIAEKRLKLRIKEYLRRENEKTIFDFTYND